MVAPFRRSVVRRCRRSFVRLEAQAVRERDFRLIGDQILDLSEFGMLVAPTSPVEVGDQVIVSFMAPFTRLWIDAEATVARVARGRRRSDRGPGIGLEFRQLNDVSRALLRTNLACLPPPLRVTR